MSRKMQSEKENMTLMQKRAVLVCVLCVLAVLLTAAYTAGLCAGKAAAHLDEDDEPKIYMDHTHGGED